MANSQQFNPLGGDKGHGDFNMSGGTYDPTTDTIHVLKAGDTMTGTLNINGGKLGIGTTSPNSAINALDGTVAEFRFNSGASALTPSLAVGNTNSSGKFAALVAGTSGAIFDFDSSGYFAIGSDIKANYLANNLGSAFTEMLRISANGNIGIGNNNPQYILDVGGQGNFNGNQIHTVADPTSAQDVATKNYVDSKVSASIGVLATVTSINTKTIAQTNLYTVPTGKTAIITAAIVRCTAATSITNGPTASIGFTASAYSDIYVGQNMIALTGTTSIFGYSTVGMSASATAASVIKFNITTAASGTSQTVAVDLIGYLI